MTDSGNKRRLTWLERRKIAEQERKEKRERRDDRKEKRRSFVIERIHALKEKFYAVAAKRKWLFYIIAALIVGYLVVSYTGFGGNVFTKIKGFFA